MLTTVPITVTLLHPNGQPVKDCYVKANLTQMDTDAATGMVFPAEVEGATGSSGSVTLNLWPNALGVTGSQYRFRAWDPSSGRRLLDEVATVPQYAANLRDIILLPAPTPLPYDEASILAIQQLRTEAVAAAGDAEGFKNEVKLTLPIVGKAAIDANAAAAAAEQSKVSAENAVAGIAQFASDAESAANIASQKSDSAEQSRLAASQAASTAAHNATLTANDALTTNADKLAATQSALKAELSAQRVEGQSLIASQSAATAQLAATHAEQSKAMASQSANNANLSHNLSRDYRDDSRQARDRAREYRESSRLWAQQKEDVPVINEDGEEPQFSAMHWALKALRYLSGGGVKDDEISPSTLWSSFKTNQVIQEEKDRAEQQELLLTQALEDEVTRSQAKELLLEQSIQAEEQSRIEADDLIEKSLEDEVTRSQAKELLLEQEIQAFRNLAELEYYKKSGGIIAGNVTIAGNLAVQGETVQVDSQISTADRMIILNDGEVGSGVTGEFSGVEVDRGTEEDYLFGFSETKQTIVLGKKTGLQAVATREDTPNDGMLAAWSALTKRFITRMVKWSDIDELDNTLPAEKIKQSTARQFLTTTEKNKLGDIAKNATKNATDLFLLNRANHSGKDQIADVEGLPEALGLKFDKSSVKQTTGTSKDDTMSQDAITRALATLTARVGDIGNQGGTGFAVGVYPNPAELYVTLGLSPMPGHDQPASENYGNYIHTNGSIMVFVPKHYIRTGHANSPRFAKYGANAIDVASIYDFDTTAKAIAAGYRLPRCFIDGGEEKHGFFFDKYDLSRHGTEAKSVRFGKTISLSTSSDYTNSVGMPDCVGQLKDSIPLAKQRGTEFTDGSAFMYGALFMLSVAHGQAATSSATCAWYDAAGTTNFPKGCNNNALADVNDTSVTFVTAGDSGSASKPLAGSANNLAKTTHNGQLSGIADLNGSILNTGLGVTVAGDSAASSTQNTSGNFMWVLKPSVKLSELTNGWGAGKDAWGNEAHLNTLYDKVTVPLDFTTTEGWINWGNGANAVFSDSPLDGILPKDNAAASAGGTNMLGNDGVYRYNRQNMYMLFAGSWGLSSYAGLGYRILNIWRVSSSHTVGTRSSAYAQ